jgi:hypothetical protein
MIKEQMKRKKPSFNETYYGYRSFTHLLEEADEAGVVDIERNPKSGTYVVVRFAGEGDESNEKRSRASGDGRRGRRRSRPAGAAARSVTPSRDTETAAPATDPTQRPGK